MTKGELLNKYKPMSIDEERAFDKWLTANAAVASIFTAALVAMAVSSSHVAVPSRALAQSGESTRQGGANIPGGEHLSPLELMTRLAPDALPQEQIENPF